jgi:preprotein translocase subunit YajC
MSGAEVITVLGLISSVIAIIETSRAVSQNIPLVLNILRDCKKVQEQISRDYSLTTDADRKRDIEESNKAVEPLLLACEENAKRLQEIFQKVIPDEDASWAERYKKAARAVLPGKKRKVEDLMKEILEKLQLLHTSRFFKSENQQKNEKKSKELEAAISQANTVTMGPGGCSSILAMERSTTTAKAVALTTSSTLDKPRTSDNISQGSIRPRLCSAGMTGNIALQSSRATGGRKGESAWAMKEYQS